MISMETTVKVKTQPKGRKIAYWTVTLPLAAAITLSGIGQVMQLGGNVELVKNLGYPLYVLSILGIWKVLGAIALVMPGFPRLKEWVHAGIFFLMTGAALSHAFANDYGDYGFNFILPLFLCCTKYRLVGTTSEEPQNEYDFLLESKQFMERLMLS